MCQYGSFSLMHIDNFGAFYCRFGPLDCSFSLPSSYIFFPYALMQIGVDFRFFGVTLRGEKEQGQAQPKYIHSDNFGAC
jgi:hypothetical protein